eukprot:268570_1
MQVALLLLLSTVLMAQPPPPPGGGKGLGPPRPVGKGLGPEVVPPPIGEILIEWPDDSDLCPDDGGIPKYGGRLPFTRGSAMGIYQWVAAMQMCFFDFVNDEMDYAALVAGDGITKDTLLCFDPTPGDDTDGDCNRMASKEINDDITTLRDYVDIHKQVYKLESFSANSFRIKGIRTVGVELDLGLGDEYKVGTKIDNEFYETYIFNDDGTLARRENHAKSELTKKLLASGKANYVHFANAVDGIVDDNGNIPIGYGGKYMYVIDKRAAFVVVVLFVVAILTSISCCLMCKMCKSARNVVYKGVATESTDTE